MNRLSAMKYAALLLLLGCSSYGSAQVQWAAKVIESSGHSNAGTKQQYLPIQALGKPDKLPATGLSAAAWSPPFDDQGTAFIHVGFKAAQKARQIAVGENHNPGSITRIEAFDSLGKAYTLYENAAPKAIAGTEGRLFNHYFPLTTYKIKSVKITLDVAAVSGPNQIDAIGISAAADTIRARINLVATNDPVPEKENLGTPVNSPTDDLSPVITPNGKRLYFTRQSHPQNIAPVSNQDIWYADIDAQGAFSEAINIGAPLNNSENSSVLSITPDGQRMLVLNVYKPDGTVEKGVSITHFNGTGWDLPKKVEIDSFYNENRYGEYCLSNSGRFLVMTLERKDAEGLKDLYVSFIKADGSWTAPKHLGDLLNTPESETSPFLCADEKTLYFSSKGRAGFGSNDMFVTHRLDDSWTRWSEPENLGSAINTPGWDAYFSLPANGEYAYYVSYTNSLGGADIFRQKLPASAKPAPVALVGGRVLHAKTRQPMRAKITYRNLSNGLVLGEGYSDSLTGKFEVALPAGYRYALLAEKNTFYSVSETIDLQQLKTYSERSKDLLMVPVEVGETARLNNLFFDFNKATLKPESFVELEQLVRLLQQTPSLEIQINGHTDDVGEIPYNLDLSKRRAKAVYDYLIGKGIAATRLAYQGFGESQPLANGTSDESRQLNRRVEFLIVKK